MRLLHLKSISVYSLLFAFLRISAQDNSAISNILTKTFENSPRVKISKIDVDYQRGVLLSSRGIFNPELNFGLNRSYDLYPENIARREGYPGYTNSNTYHTDLLDYYVSVSKRFQFGMLIEPSISLKSVKPLRQSMRRAVHSIQVWSFREAIAF